MAIKEGAQIDTMPVQLYGWNGAPVRLKVNSDGTIADALGIPEHDEIDVAYSGGNPVTVAFKLDGAVVSTLTLTYTGGVPTNIVKS